MQRQNQPAPLNPASFDRLNRGVANFGGVQVSNFFRDHYHLFPGNDEKRAFLGEGAYGKAYTVRSATNPSDSVKVCKVMSLKKVAQRDREILHVCAELAVLTKISPNCPRLNRARGIFYDHEMLYVVLDMTEARTPDLATRLYGLMATYRPQSIPEVEVLIERIHAAWEKKIPEYTNHYKTVRKDDDEDLEHLEAYLAGKRALYCDKQILIIMGKLGVKAEAGNRMDLYDCVHTSHRKKLSEKKAAVILKQCLQGVEFLHQSSVVHRDIKTENVIIGISKIATPKRDAEGKVVGVTFREQIDAQLIDFGLAKHLRGTNQGVAQTPTLNMFGVGGAVPVAPGSDTGAAAGGFGLGASTVPAPASGGFGIGTSTTAPSDAGAGGWANAAMPETASSTVTNDFQLSCTPCGTEVFTALEGLLGFAGRGTKGHWISTSQDLPKLDIFGCGAMMYCMTHGHNPFRAPPTAPGGGQVRGLAKIEALIGIISRGPQINQGLSEPTKNLILKLLLNDAKKRPSAADILQDTYFSDVTDTYTYTVDLQGNEHVEVVGLTPHPPKAPKPSRVEVDASIEEMTDKMEATHSDAVESQMDPKHQECDVNSALRGKEDDGDSEGKVRDTPIEE